MKTQYKIWVTIEKIVTTGDDETYEDVAETVSVGPFDTLEEADRVVVAMTGESTGGGSSC